MRFVIFFLIFSLILSAAGYVAYLAPYHIYTLAISEGIKTDFIETKPLPIEILKGGEYKIEKVEQGKVIENDRLWPLFHFTHFKVPFPVHHPLYNLIPIIDSSKNDKKKIDLGIKITNRDDVDVANLVVRNAIKFTLDIGKYKLFNLPIFKKMILDKDLEQLWKDLFLKDITLPNYEKLGIYKYTLAIQKYPYDELVYNLFLSKMRSEIFPSNSYKIGMLKDRDIGIVELVNKNNKYSHELVYIKTKNKIRVLDLTTAKYKRSGRRYKNRLLEKVQFLPSEDASAVHLYTFFRELDYVKKTDQEGMIYLFSAWSHNTREKGFLVQMIQWLERGKGNGKQLIPLYEYATKVYGTSFSKDVQKREDAQQRLERKIKEEIEDEITDEKGNVYKIQDGKFETDEKQREYFLQKAKDDDENSDEDEDILIVE